MPASPRRAAPLPADERRAAILRATVPLLREHGTRISTRQIAAAADVAEGTLFRVFPDKNSLVEAALQSAFSPEPLLEGLAKVDATLPLDERLLAIVELLQHRLSGIIELMTAVGRNRPPGDGPPGSGTRPPRDTAQGEFLERVAALLEPDRDVLSIPPHKVARMLRLLTFAGTHPVISDGDPLTATEIVAVILDGVRRPHGATPPHRKALPRKRNPNNRSSKGTSSGTSQSREA